ncbi:MAG: VWA domain-containing protein [Blastocatellia bacterium]|nr:VWA domain-containing protein [Blastocatellia bacterium]
MKSGFFLQNLRLGLCLVLFLPLWAAAQQPNINPVPNNQKPPKDETLLRVKTEGALPDEATVVKVRTQLVVVPFTVTDRRNRYVNDLKLEDLQVFENGQKQDIASLGRTTEAPLALALLVDFSGSMLGRLALARRTAVQFLEKVLRLKDDQAALIVFQQDVVLAAPLTHDVAALKQSLAEVDYRLPSPVGQIMPFDTSNKAAGTALHAALYLAVDDVLARTTVPNARRVIVLLTDGYDGEGSVQLREAIDRAWRSGVSVYPIGITSPTEETAKDVNREALERLASATGGRVFYPRHDREFANAFTQIEEDLRQQYVLTYFPTGAKDDAFHTLKIEIPQRTDLQTHHRLGFYAAGDEKPVKE